MRFKALELDLGSSTEGSLEREFGGLSRNFVELDLRGRGGLDGVVYGRGLSLGLAELDIRSLDCLNGIEVDLIHFHLRGFEREVD